MNKKDSENTEITESKEKNLAPLTPSQEELKGVKWRDWKVNKGNVPCPTGDNDLVHIKQRNGNQNVGIAKNLGNWEFGGELDEFPGDIIAYRNGYRKSQRVKGKLESLDDTHEFRVGDDVYAKDRRKIMSGDIVGWIEGEESDKPARYIVRLSGEKTLKEFTPDMIEMDGVRWSDED